MYRRKKHVAVPGVQLFPFLAVLICTFGVLIVLLVLVVNKADVNATRLRQEAEQVATDAKNKLETKLELLRFQMEAFSANRDKLHDQLIDARKRRSYLKQSLDDLQSKRRLLAIEYSQLKQQTQPSQQKHEEITERLTQVTAEVSALKKTWNKSLRKHALSHRRRTRSYLTKGQEEPTVARFLLNVGPTGSIFVPLESV